MSRIEPSSAKVLEGGGALELPSTAASMADSFVPTSDTSRTSSQQGDDQWLMTAQQVYRDSTDFFDANLRTRMEESMDLYRSKHPAGSKYNLPSFQKRSRLFRPKIRSAMRKKEAQIAKAFFSTNDIVSVTAPNPADPLQLQAAKVQEELLNYRLKKTVKWFATVVGAFQDASRQGFVVSRTDWDYRTARRYYATTDPATGETVRSHEDKVIKDTPVVVLIPGENIRVSPNCDWTDPIESSDYVVELMPMSLRAVREMMERNSMFRFREVDDAVLLGGSKPMADSVRRAREGNRQDRYDSHTGINDYDTVWIHRNIVRIEGEDYIYLTVGTTHMLTDPMPLIELDPRGYRGYEWGWTVIESHNPYPDGDVQMAKPVQEEINEVANMRADAVKMATIGRYFVKRNSSVDTQALVRFVPGSSIEVNNTQSDVRWDKSPDAGRGAFEEQNLLNGDLDDLLGNFSSSSVNANRRLSETVGGMELIADNTNEISEFTARVFTETWMEPVLTHIVDLLCLWETDQTVAQIIGDRVKADVASVFRALASPMGVVVGVGFGSTNPEQRVRRLQIGLGVLGEFAPMLVQGADQGEIAGEIMGALGYPDASRFFPALGDSEKDPMVAQLEQQVQQLTSMLEGKQLEMQSREKIAQINADTKVRVEEMRQASAERTLQLKNEITMLVEKGRGEIAMIDLRLKYETNEQRKMELYMQREALSHTIQMAEREFQFKLEQAQQTAALEGQPAPRGPGEGGNRGIRQLVENLRNPSSQSVDLNDADVGLPPSGGDDKSGVLARGNYGNIPFSEG